jgi:4-carboxymuconolactone decarboxylase
MAERLPYPENPTAAQTLAAEAVVSGPRGVLVGPFVPLLRAPELMTRVQELGAHIRYETVLEDHLRELVILQVARHWDQEFEWGHHQPIALEAGLPASVVDSLSVGVQPQGVDPDVAAVWALVHSLLTTRQVGDDTYEAAMAVLDDRRLVEVVTTVGYYSTLAMVMNAARTPPEADAPRLGAATADP